MLLLDWRTAAEPREFDKSFEAGALRALLAGAGRWSCWSGGARTAVRLAVSVLAVAQWRGWLAWWPKLQDVVETRREEADDG